MFVYYGEGQDETTGLATKVISSGDKVIAVSGHLIGSLAADKSDGSKIEIYNSKAQGGAYYMQHLMQSKMDLMTDLLFLLMLIREMRNG